MKIFILKCFKLFFKLPYSSRFYLFILKNIINKYQIGKNLKSRVLIFQSVNLNLRLDDWLQQQIYFLGRYEAFELEVLRSRIRTGSNVIDIGANIGLYSLFAASIVGKEGKVFSFEPYSINFDILKENLEINNFSNVTLNKIAIANKEDEIKLFYNPKEYNLGMVSAFEHNYKESETVKSITLDSYLNNLSLTHISFIKIDIEGGEYLALLGMKDAINKYKPFIQIEIDEDILKNTPYSKNDILLFFEMANYKLINPKINQVKENKFSKNYFFQPN